MEVETKYIAPQSAPFVALMQAPEVGGYHLEPMPAVSVRDVYLDTAAGDLLRQGYVFRVREQEGGVIATLKSVGAAEGALHRRLEFEAALGTPLADGRLPILPEGDLRAELDRLVGSEALLETVRLRQYRSPRAVFDGSRLVGVVSLDVVAQETRQALHVTNEVEVELAETGREEDLYRLDPVLRARGLEPVAQSKFERALLRVQAEAGAPLRLLPAERVVLERYQEAGTPLHRRRARVVLLAARGLRPATIASKAGLSPSRVQHWIEAFRADRLAIFAGEPEAEEPLAERRAAPSYRIAELVTGGTPRPTLFRRDHFEPEPEAEVERIEELEAERQAPEPVPSHAFGDGSHVQPGALAPSFTDAPDEPEAEDDETPGAAAPSDGRDLDGGEGAVAGTAEGGDAPAAPSEAAAKEDPEGEAPFAQVESLDDLLDLLDAGPATTPNLSGRTPMPDPEPTAEIPVPDEAAARPEAAPEAVDEDTTMAADRAEPEAQEATEAEAPGMEAVASTAAPPATSDAETDGEGAEQSVLRPGARRPAARRPVLSADDPVLAACERVLRYHIDGLHEATERLLGDPVPQAVRRALIAAHRVRIALELFGDHLPPRTARRLHRGLRGTARALDHLGDQDLVLAHVTDAQVAATDEDRPAFDALLEAIEAERQAAWQSVALRLRGALHQQWARRAERLLDLLAAQVQAGLTVGDHAREEPDDYLDEEPERPSRDRLRHLLGSTLWSRYEALRAYDSVVGQAGDELLHPLGVACSALQFALGLAAGCAADEVRPVARPLAEVESHLALLHHVRLTLDALASYPGAAPVAALRERLQTLHDDTLREAPERWERIAGPAYRAGLAQVVASI